MKELSDSEIDAQPASISFDELQIGDIVLDFTDGEYGEITDIIADSEEPEWTRIEVEWLRESGINDKSFVLPGTSLGVLITETHPRYAGIVADMGESFDALYEEHGDGLQIMALARW